MTRLMAATTALTMALAFGCKPHDSDGADGVRSSLPSSDQLQIKLPGATGASAMEGGPEGDIDATDLALLGQTADMYLFTRSVSTDLNRGAAFILLLVHTIVQYPVTSVEGDTYIWGPWTETLNPSQWRLTVTQDTAGDYHWSVEARLKADGPMAAYSSVVSGIASPGVYPGRGSGSFSIDFDQAERLDPGGNDGVGKIDVVYDLTTSPASVEMDYENAAGARFHYSYAEASDGTGDFQFVIDADFDENGSAMEHGEIRSRWQSTGAGRADLRLTGGDAGSIVITGSECWDTSFARTYWTDSAQMQPTEGDAASCAFADVKLPE